MFVYFLARSNIRIFVYLNYCRYQLVRIADALVYFVAYVQSGKKEWEEWLANSYIPVSYTYLDVYKRQVYACIVAIHFQITKIPSGHTDVPIPPKYMVQFPFPSKIHPQNLISCVGGITIRRYGIIPSYRWILRLYPKMFENLKPFKNYWNRKTNVILYINTKRFSSSMPNQ